MNELKTSVKFYYPAIKVLEKVLINYLEFVESDAEYRQVAKLLQHLYLVSQK